jgi:Polyketide cyclase / dehydrase and lipid transport
LGYFEDVPDPRHVVHVERVIRAPASVIFDVLADPRRHPDVDGSGTLIEARPGSPTRLSQGVDFAMNMRRGLPYGMVNTVTEFEEGQRIAWAPTPANGRAARLFGRIWRYELEPVDGGTLVRETWDLSHDALRWILRTVYSSRFRRDMTRTLERLDDLVTIKS